MSRSTVLFVNTRPTRLEAEPCYRAARALGLDVILLADRPLPVPAGAFDEWVSVDTYDSPALVAAARKVAATREVRGVVCWGDRDVEGVAAVAAALNLPGHSPEAARAARNKAVFRARLAEAAPSLSVQTRLVDPTREVLTLPEGMTFPVVVKPAGASASKGVFVVRDADSLREAGERLAAFTRPEVDPIFRYYPAQVLIEEFIDGSEHSVEGLVQGGELISAVVTDKWVASDFAVEYQERHPSALPQTTEQRVVDATRQAVAALGLGTGVFHLELRVTAGGAIKLLECNARTGGGYITSHMVALTRGYDFLDATLRLACGMTVTPIPPSFAHAAGRTILATCTGRFVGIDGLEKALAYPGVMFVAVDAEPGSMVSVPPAGYNVELASVVVLGYSAEGVLTILDDVSALLHPRVVPA